MPFWQLIKVGIKKVCRIENPPRMLSQKRRKTDCNYHTEMYRLIKMRFWRNGANNNHISTYNGNFLFCLQTRCLFETVCESGTPQIKKFHGEAFGNNGANDNRANTRSGNFYFGFAFKTVCAERSAD